MATATVYRTATEEGTKTTRAQRGLALYRERGGEIVRYPSTGEYGVPSNSEEGVIYHVDLDRGTCECPDNAYGKNTCMHQVAAEAKRIGLGRKAAPKVPARRRCSAPPMAVRSRMARDFLKRYELGPERATS